MKADQQVKRQGQKQEERGNKHTLLKEVYENVSRETIFTPDQIGEVLELAQVEKYLIKSKGIEIFNICASFDIETYSFYDHKDKRAAMYVWMFSVNGLCIVGRTWEEFEEMCLKISDILGLYEKKILLVYVHNLAYEFQFIRKRFIWSKVFAVEERKPVYALSDMGIEFRCSYLLTGYSLATVAKNLQYKIKKLDSLDYSIARHSETPLTSEELQYCLNDVKIVVLYLAELLQTEWNINTVPITKTGFVRRFCRECCMVDQENRKNKFKRMRYNEIMSNMTMTLPEYTQLKRAFQGGFTHASAWYSGRVVHNAKSYDEISAYPFVMVAMQYPMSKPEHIDQISEKEFLNSLKLYCCCFDIYFEELEAITTFENYLSSSRCWHKEEYSENNGRIVEAKRVWTTLTEQDFFIISKMYRWKKMKVANFMRFKRDYLPRDFVKAVLTLYADKTTLKGVEGQEVEYIGKKEMLNSTYGMSVTDPIRNNIYYEEDWKTKEPDALEVLEKYNTDRNRFLYYPWGVWVTAYARNRLLRAILEVGENDYLYADTDSVKFLHSEDHEDFFRKENDRALELLEAARQFHHFPKSFMTPKTKEGVEKPLGVWDYDGEYKTFKALRAKAYLTEDYSGDLHLTVAGLNKKVTVPYLKQKYKTTESIFEAFADGLSVPPDSTGKNTHTYIDEETSGQIKDFRGVTFQFHELSSVHLEAGGYDLSLTEEYVNFLLTINTDQAL